MEIQSKIQDIEKRGEKEREEKNKDIEEKWNNLSIEEKKEVIDEINQNVDYQWDPRFWPKVAFQTLPPVLRNLVKKYSRKYLRKYTGTRISTENH